MAGSLALGVDATGITVAERADDAELRALLRQSVMPGAVRVALTREPDFFAADGLAGADDVTLVSRRHGRVVGMGRLSVYPLLRNGRPRRIGYLGALRITSGTGESVRMLRDGYERLAHTAAGSADGCFTSIATDNTRARRVLENGTRFGLPSYRPLCNLVTLIAPVTRLSSPQETADEAELVDFLAGEAPHGQLALAWDTDRLRDLARHGIAAKSFRVVRQEGKIVGAAAVWDQRAFRQTVIDGYSRALDLLRTPFNLVQAAMHRPALPSPGAVLAHGALLGACVRRPDDWSRLWPIVGARAAELGLSWLSIARDARDPELRVLRDLPGGREYRTTLYEVTWRGGQRWPDPWDDRCFRPEVGLL